jgi:hypothetical protein
MAVNPHRRQFDPEPPTEQHDVVEVLGFQVVAAVKSNEPLGGYAADLSTFDEAKSGERIGPVVFPILRRPVDAIAVFIERERVDV